MFSKLVDRYIFKQLLDYFLLGVVVFTLIAFFSDTLLNLVREVQKYGVAPSTLLTLIGLQLPKSVVFMLPASAFLAVLMVYNQLNNQFEIISFRMNGISLWRLMLPAVVLGLFTSAVTYTVGDYLVPWCNAKTVQLKQQVIRSGSLPSNGNSFLFGSYDENHSLVQLIYVNHYQGRQLGDSTIIDLANPSVMNILQAREGTWDTTKGWNFRNVNTYHVGRDREHSAAGHEGDLWIQGLIRDQKIQDAKREALKRGSEGVDVRSSEQSFPELWHTLKRREALGKRLFKSHYLDLWQKITWPLAALVLVLSAVPLAISPPREGNSRGFVFAIAVLSVFYLLYSSIQGMGKNVYFDFGGALSVQGYLALVSWLPLIIMTVIGFLLIQRKSYVL